MVYVTFAMYIVTVHCYLLQLQVAFAKGQLKGKIAVESDAKKSFINKVVSVQSQFSL